jgi:hypothetical protein
MENEKTEFVKFGTRQRDNHTYALDDKGVVWMNIEADLWESLEEVPRQIRKSLTIDQVAQIMRQRNVIVV